MPSCLDREEDSLLEEEIKTLLAKGAVERIRSLSGGFFSTVFFVSKKDSGRHPVVNLKRLNKFVALCHFKMEGLHTVKELVCPGDWLAKIDLKDAYFCRSDSGSTDNT